MGLKAEPENRTLQVFTLKRRNLAMNLALDLI